MDKKSNENNPKHSNVQQLFLETKNVKFRSNGKLSIPRAEEGYCNEPKRSRTSTQSEPPAQNVSKNMEVKKKRIAWTREEISYMLPYILQKVSHRQL